jgi:hypothetical protein
MLSKSANPIHTDVVFARRKSFNPKHSFAGAPSEDDIKRWLAKVCYGGNPEHKKNPGDYGLTPPSIPRPDKTLCDLAGIFNRAQALQLLKDGIQKGLISQQTRGGFPQNVWAVCKVNNQDIALEAQLENAGNGTYHGYPLPEDDAFREKVLHRWNQANE